jgi:hypothetical protein
MEEQQLKKIALWLEIIADELYVARRTKKWRARAETGLIYGTAKAAIIWSTELRKCGTLPGETWPKREVLRLCRESVFPDLPMVPSAAD